MIKETVAAGGLTSLASIGLIVFFVVFVGVVAWAMTRRRIQIDRWASLPLYEGDRPAIGGASSLSIVATNSDSNGCGRCEVCTCQQD